MRRLFNCLPPLPNVSLQNHASLMRWNRTSKSRDRGRHVSMREDGVSVTHTIFRFLQGMWQGAVQGRMAAKSGPTLACDLH